MALAAAIAGGVGMLGSSVIGAVQAGEDRDLAREATAKALEAFAAVGAPPELFEPIMLEQFKIAGILTPEVEKAINLEASKVAAIPENQRLKEVNMAVLDKMRSTMDRGLTPEILAQLNDIATEDAIRNRGQQEQIKQDLAQRGMGGAGQELAMRLAAQQGGANQAAQRTFNLGALASQNALEGARMTGNFSTGLQASDFNRDFQRASAAEQMDIFNAQNAISRQQRNVDRSTQANIANLQRQQQVSDANISQANQELYRQAEARRQNWLDKLSLAQAQSGAYTQGAQTHAANAASTAEQWGQIAGGFGSIAGGGLKAMK